MNLAGDAENAAFRQCLRNTRKNKKPCARFPGHRARFFYDDLLEIFSFQRVAASHLFLQGSVLMKVPLFITGLQHAAILDHDAKPARKMKRPQKPLHGRGKHFGRAHLAAKLAKVVFLILSIPNVQHKQFPHLPPLFSYDERPIV